MVSRISQVARCKVMEEVLTTLRILLGAAAHTFDHPHIHFEGKAEDVEHGTAIKALMDVLTQGVCCDPLLIAELWVIKRAEGSQLLN